MKLRSKIFLLLTPLIICPVLTIGWLGYGQLKKNTEHNLFDRANEQISNVKRIANTTRITAQANIELLSLDRAIKKYATTKDEYSRYTLLQPTILKLFSTYQSAYPNYYEIRFIMPDGYEDVRLSTMTSLVNASENESSTPLFKIMANSNGQPGIATLKNPDNSKTVLYVFKPIIERDITIESHNVEPTLRGYLVLTVDLDFITTEIEKSDISANSQIYVTNKNEIIYPQSPLENSSNLYSSKTLIELQEQNDGGHKLTTINDKHYHDDHKLVTINDKHLFLTSENLIDDIFIYNFVPEKDIMAEGKTLAKLAVLIFLITIVLTFLFIYLALDYYILNPVKKLSNKTLAIAKGEFTEIDESDSSDEIGTLVNSFSKMSNDLKASDLARKDAEEKLIAKERLSALGQMAGTVAHDFNNLLTVVIGNLKLLKESPQGDPVDNQKMMDAAISAAETGAQLTRGLLTVSRKQVLHPESIDVNRLLHDFVSLASSTIPKTISFDLDIDKNSYFIYVDKNQIQNALFNLAINSRDAMPKGGTITLSVRTRIVETQAEDDKNDTSIPKFVTISLTDTGSGISSEIIEKVREPFFTTKGVGKGTGLGLSAVNEFVTQSDGEVEIISAPGEGTTVSLSLPLSHYKKSEETEHKSDELKTGTETILVTDDEPMVRMVGVNMLKRLGYQILEADNADNAIEIIESGVAIDLVFSDVNMPGSMDGHGLALWVKQNRPEIKFLITSGYYELSDLNKSDQHHHSITPVLAKPYAIAKLAEKIRVELDK